MSDIVERLRDDWDCAEGDEAAAEIERLREIIVQIQNEREAVIKVCVADETERLRGLLQEALIPPVRLRVIPQGEDWIRRVCEALEA